LKVALNKRHITKNRPEKATATTTKKSRTSFPPNEYEKNKNNEDILPLKKMKVNNK